MAIDFELVIESLGSHLIGSISYLGSQGTVWYSDDEQTLNAGYSRLPAGYGIQMMDPRESIAPLIGRLRRQVFEIDLKLMRKRSGPLPTRLMGTGGGDKGIYEFAKDVEDTLLHNHLGTVLEPYPGASIDEFRYEDSQAETAIARTTFRGWLTS